MSKFNLTILSFLKIFPNRAQAAKLCRLFHPFNEFKDKPLPAAPLIYTCLFVLVLVFLEPSRKRFRSSLRVTRAVSVAAVGSDWPMTVSCSCPGCGCPVQPAFCPAPPS